MNIRHLYRNRVHLDMDMPNLELKIRDLGSKIRHIHIAIRYSEREMRNLASKIRDRKVKMSVCRFLSCTVSKQIKAITSY